MHQFAGALVPAQASTPTPMSNQCTHAPAQSSSLLPMQPVKPHINWVVSSAGPQMADAVTSAISSAGAVAADSEWLHDGRFYCFFNNWSTGAVGG